MSEALLATCWTTAGDAAPLRGNERSPLPLRDRIEAASAAGFRGFGMNYPDLRQAERQYGRAGIRSMLEDNGLVHRELELLTNWWADGALRVQSDSVRRGLLAAAEALGADHIKIGPPGSDSPWDPDRWAGELAALAAEAAEAGARVGLEFLPWTAIKTVHDGMELVESAGHPAAGLIIDVWHTERTHTPAAELATIPLWRIVGVELSDADEQCIGTLFEDSANRRRLCGHGSFDLPGDIRALRAAGWTGPWGVEILSETFRRLNVREAAARAFATAVAQLELATAGTQTGADPSPPAGLGRQITGRPRSEEA